MRVIVISILTCLVRGQPEMESYVVHGSKAKIEDFPYVAYMAVEQDQFPWSCGSSIINQQLTLTAAHCLSSCDVEAKIILYVGNEQMLNGVISSASGFVIHENYDTETSVNDIALVRVKTPIIFNEKVSRVALMRQPPHDDEAFIAGWGVTNEKKREETEMLIFTSQRVWSNKDCVNSLKNMPSGTFCASDQSGAGYPSVGDSGSALVIHKYIQIGLVSYKKPDVSRKIIVYTDTGYFFNWIHKNSKRLMCNKYFDR